MNLSVADAAPLAAEPVVRRPSLAGRTRAGLDAALAEIKPQVAAAPAPSAETIKLTQASEEELDAELLSIFLEEAQEVLGTIGSHIGLLREQPHNVDFLTTIRRVALLTSEKSSSVKLAFGKDSATLSANSPDVGEARESIAVKYRGKDFSAAFNPEYLMDPLRNLPDDEVHFDFIDETSPGVIRVSSSSFLYVIMPMRMA